MALPTPDQLAGMAVAREAQRVLIPPEVKQMVDNMNRKADEGRWRESLGGARMDPDTGQKIAAKNEEIGIEYDVTSGKKTRSPEEQNRFSEANKLAARNEKFLRVGYDGMDSASGGEQEQLRADVLAEASLIPVLRVQLERMGPTNQKQFAERILREGGFSAEGKRIMDRILNPENKLIGDNLIFQKQDELTEAELKRDNKDREVTDLQRQVRAVEQQMRRFERDLSGAPTGGDAVELDRLRALRPHHQAGLATDKRTLQVKQTELVNVTEEYNSSKSQGWTGRKTAEILKEKNSLRSDIENLQDEIHTKEADLQKLQALEQDEQRLEQRKADLAKEQRDRELERDTSALEVRKKQRELDDMKRVRVSQETDLVSGYKNLIREAAAKTFQFQLQAEAESANTELDELKQKTADQNEKAMYDALRERWLGPVRERGWIRIHKYRPIDSDKVDKDFRLLMGNGPEALMREILKNRINPETHAVYTQSQVDALINKKDYVEKLQSEVVKHLLSRRILTGGMTQEDIYQISTAQWGEGMVTEALSKNEKFRKEVEGVMGADALSRHGFHSRFWQEMKRRPGWLLLLLIGGPLAWGIGAARMTPMVEDIAA